MHGKSGAPVAGIEVRSDRDTGLDLGKVAAFVAVVFLHVGFPRSTPVPLVWMIDQTARFAVPFFFITSGYLLKDRLASFSLMFRYVTTRIAPAFLVWLLFYHWPNIRDGHVQVLKMLWTGGGLHLWYFSALIISLLLGCLTLRLGGLTALIIVAVALYAVAVACGGEAQMFGVHHITWDTRLGPFFGLPFITIGTVLARLPWRPSLLIAAILFALGIGAQLGEDLLLGWDIGAGWLFPDFVVTTPLLGAGAFLFFRALPASPLLTRCSRPGLVVLGAYAVHPYLLFLPLAHHDTTSATFAVVAAVVALSLAISTSMASQSSIAFAFK